MSYQHAAARGASALGQIVALYDTILRDFGRALAALKCGDVEKRVFELNHAIIVIGHLQGALDHERGGEAAKQFERLYKVTLGMIVNANIRATSESLEELIEMYGGLRQAWSQAEQQSATPPVQSPVPLHRGIPAEAHATNPMNTDAEMPQRHWST
jgi:flagellar protein FliS